jgi:hypothetical protein
MSCIKYTVLKLVVMHIVYFTHDIIYEFSQTFTWILGFCIVHLMMIEGLKHVVYH